MDITYRVGNQNPSHVPPPNYLLPKKVNEFWLFNSIALAMQLDFHLNSLQINPPDLNCKYPFRHSLLHFDFLLVPFHLKNQKYVLCTLNYKTIPITTKIQLNGETIRCDHHSKNSN